ncbi:MAG: SH3 domain-containing C40 family peptidase [Clostridiales bacterium]|nr:SH3 domain-containing C40 family peptidase [Clostridiales bacterium]
MKEALVKSSIAGLMSEAKMLSALEDEVIYGMKVQVLEKVVPGWYRVRTHYRYEALISEADLLFDEEKIKQWEQAKRAVVLHTYADVLTENRVQGAIKISLPRGAQVILLDDTAEDGWTQVGLVDGQSGYIKSSFLGELKPSMYVDEFIDYKKGLADKSRITQFINEKYGLNEDEFRQKVVNSALSYLGTQYRWGGKTSLGIDCSGLVSMAYMLNGVDIYRDAKIKEGFPVHEIKLEEKKPGDLLFFPGHVAMYIGNDRYVHSTARKGSDGVVINSLNKEHDDYREDLLNNLSAVGSIF